ncbi:MAG: hypothetical protein AAF572_15265 [Cyanobacteria bacterium P01_B01_bin.77]
MLIGIVIANVAISLLCFILTWRIAQISRQVTQLNRDLNRWAVLLEQTLAQHTLTLTEQRTHLHQWQLLHLRWQLQQRRLLQIAKFLRLVWRIMGKRRLP